MSARREMNNYSQSIQYSLDRIKATGQELAVDFLDSQFLKDFIEFGNGALQILDELIEKTNGFGVAIAGLGIFELFKHGKDIGKPKRRVSQKWADNISVLMDTSVFLYAA